VARLEVEDVAVRFGGVQALSGVSLEVLPGRVTGLIGPNGAGKTTIFNVITGLQAPDRGKVMLDGRDIVALPPHRRARLGVARTFQRLELFGTLSARENVQMAVETRVATRKAPGEGFRQAFTAALRRGPSEAASEADHLLSKVGAAHVADEPGDLLPTGLARLVELARALATAPSLLLLDEPSAGLDEAETTELGRVLGALASEGMGVLLVEHDMGLVMNVCSHVAVMDAGSVIAQGDPYTIQRDPSVQAAYLGTDTPASGAPAPSAAPGAAAPSADSADSADSAASAASADSADSAAQPVSANGSAKVAQLQAPGPPGLWAATPAAPAASANGSAQPRPSGDHELWAGNKPRNGKLSNVLEIRDLRAGYGRIEVLHGVSLEVPKASVVALLGPNGAGKSTLLKVASGQLEAMSGSVLLDGQDVAGRSGGRVVRRGLCAVPEGRPVFPNLTVAENLRMYSYARDDIRSDELEAQSYERFPVLRARRRQLAGSLSGGEQQSLALARAFGSGARVLLLDEISMGLAPLIVGQLYEHVGRLVEEEGVAVLLVEQFAKMALALAQEAAIMVNGRIARRGSPSEMESELVRSYLGQ
jgi:branched-chain amino acid transport system ATP-binding protein